MARSAREDLYDHESSRKARGSEAKKGDDETIEPPAKKDDSGGGKDAAPASDANAGHAEERAALLKSFENEMRDLHGGHRENMRKMFDRHGELYSAMLARHAAAGETPAEEAKAGEGE